MTRELFIESIEAIQKQYELDIEVSEFLGRAFPDAFSAGLMPRNHFLSNALVHILQVEMNDEHKDSWIEYFVWELDFGKENYRVKAYEKDGSEIKLSNAGELYDFLIKN